MTAIGKACRKEFRLGSKRASRKACKHLSRRAKPLGEPQWKHGRCLLRKIGLSRVAAKEAVKQYWKV